MPLAPAIHKGTRELISRWDSPGTPARTLANPIARYVPEYPFVLPQVHVCPHTEGDGWALQDRQGNVVDKARFEEHFKPQVAAPPAPYKTSRVLFLVPVLVSSSCLSPRPIIVWPEHPIIYQDLESTRRCFMGLRASESVSIESSTGFKCCSQH